MATDRLNTFRCFLTKKEGHENHLTRAFLVLLRLVPEAHAAFLEEVGRRRSLGSPSLPDLKEPSAASFATWRTQTRDLSGMAGRLLSVVVAKEISPQAIPVRRAQRRAVYDGVIGYGSAWTFIIEVKTRRKQVYVSQASPDESSVAHIADEDIESPAVVLAWPDLIKRLAALMKGKLLGGVSQALLGDFLTYAHEVFPSLNPFDRLSMCRENLELINERCEAILTEIGPGRVQYHRGWGCSLRFPSGAVQQVLLSGDRTDGDPEIVLECEPGDVKGQSGVLYPSLSIDALLALKKHGWTILPNLHFSFKGKGLVSAHGNLPLDEYLRAVKELVRPVKGPDIAGRWHLRGAEGKPFLDLVTTLHQGAFITKDDVEAIHAKFTRTKRTGVEVNPGLKMLYRWPLKAASEFDDRATFASEVRERIRDAFGTWGQTDPILDDNSTSA